MVEEKRPESTFTIADLHMKQTAKNPVKKLDKSVKVLGICGSPRLHGNTQIMLETTLRVCKEAGAETELILLRGKDIRPCDACEGCQKTGRCHIKDDMQDIYPKLWQANGIIIGSPTYGMGITALTRLFLDRASHAIWMTGKPGEIGKGYTNTVGGAVLVAGRTGSSLAFSTLAAEFTLGSWVFAGAAFGYAWDKGDVVKDKTGIMEATVLGDKVVRYLNFVKREAMEIKS
jgi:multimeric flavodoxin WrbA